MVHRAAAAVAGLIVLSAAAAVPAQEATAILVPDGFRATVFADDLGRARHLAVRQTGEVYVILRTRARGGGIVGLRDRDSDGRAEEVERFGDIAGTGIAIAGDWLYAASDEAVVRFRLQPGRLVPAGRPETIVSGFPSQRGHVAKPIAVDGRGGLYVNVGSPSNACQERDRTKGSAGRQPCPQLARHAGIWRFDANRPGQTQADGVRYATGLRNTVALAWNASANALYGVVHGRDQLAGNWPDRFTAADNAELPAEEFHRIERGGDYGWPYTYFDGRANRRMVAPEYGGDGRTPAAIGRYPDPLVAFPAHYAPNALAFYVGDKFPERYRGGAFVAFHGSWNRAPLPQAGFLVAFVPFTDGKPAGKWEVFADGFAGAASVGSPGEARYRPMALGVAPDGALYVGDSAHGRIWRIVPAGPRD